MAINKNDFFQQLNDGTKWDTAVSFLRNNPLPIDSLSVFPSISALETYINGPLSYPGQVVAVVFSDTHVETYVINGDGSYTSSGGSTWSVLQVPNNS